MVRDPTGLKVTADATRNTGRPRASELITPMSSSLTATRSRRRSRGGPRELRHRPAVLRALARAQRAGGPEDRALYACCCGRQFTAEVSASVCCPHCGAEQTW